MCDYLRDLVMKIHATPHKVVLAITGGGAEAIGELLRHGQGSNTLLEAVVPYDQKSFEKFVRGKPDKHCSMDAANDLAMAAWLRAKELAGEEDAANADVPTPLLGVGVTCSLTKDNEREGRQHHAYVAIQDDDGTYNYEVDLTDKVRTRNEQESLVARCIIQGLATTCGVKVTGITNFANGVSYGMSRDYIEVAKGHLDVAPEYVDRWDRVIFSGSFNPMHEQHEQIAAYVAKKTGKKVDLEVCIRNVDKPALSHAVIARRRDHLIEKMYEKPWAGDLLFTSLPTFLAKCKAFPNATFVMGWDTFVRLGDPKYADLNEVVETFKRRGTKFVVFHRIVNGVSSAEAASTLIYPPLLEFVEIIPPAELPLVEISSSIIRKGK